MLCTSEWNQANDEMRNEKSYSKQTENYGHTHLVNVKNHNRRTLPKAELYLHTKCWCRNEMRNVPLFLGLSGPLFRLAGLRLDDVFRLFVGLEALFEVLVSVCSVLEELCELWLEAVQVIITECSSPSLESSLESPVNGIERICDARYRPPRQWPNQSNILVNQAPLSHPQWLLLTPLTVA